MKVQLPVVARHEMLLIAEENRVESNLQFQIRSFRVGPSGELVASAPCIPPTVLAEWLIGTAHSILRDMNAQNSAAG